MLKTVSILLRGAAADAEQDLIDRNAIPVLNQQIRDAAAALEEGKRALALAMAQEEAEARRLAGMEASLADLEGRAVAALRGGREDLATDAAAAILALGADRDASRAVHATFGKEVEAMRRAHADGARRLAALQRGRTVAQATEAIRRLRAGRLRDAPAAGSLAEAEATLARLRARQSGDAAAEAALDRIEAGDTDEAASAVATRLGAAGFGPRTAPDLGEVMARLKAKAAAPSPAPASAPASALVAPHA